MIRNPRFLLVVALLTGTLLAGCATTRPPDIRVDSAPDADFSRYSTFGFPAQTGTDRGGYSTIITGNFKTAVIEQMERRGYRYVDANPSLLVNFYANVRERSEVRSTRRPPAFGYYGYRYGLYSAWPLYENDLETVTYPVGTVNIDVVDAREKRLIWEGVATGRVSDKDMENPQPAIANVVAQLFAHFPGSAAAVDAAARAGDALDTAETVGEVN